MRRRITLAAALALLLAATGCATTDSVDSKVEPAALKSTGLVLFSVTHEKDNERLGRAGANVYFRVDLRDLDKGSDRRQAFSLDPASLLPTSAFGPLWGQYFVRELPAGRYAFEGWTVEQNTGVGWITPKPEKPVLPLGFEVAPGSVTYLGNVHARLLWRKNVFGIDLLAGAVPEIRNEEQRDLALIVKAYPQLQGRVVVAPLRPGPWMPE